MKATIVGADAPKWEALKQHIAKFPTDEDSEHNLTEWMDMVFKWRKELERMVNE